MSSLDPLEIAKPFYAEPQRHFHTWDHIEHLLWLFEEWKHELKRPNAIKLVILFHDAVYQPGDPDNEAKSVALMKEKLGGNADLEFAELVILNTKEHKPLTNTPADLVRDCQFMLDMDMAVLGGEPDAYDSYAQQIRQEFSFVPDEIFAAGRRAFLKELLERKEIFYTVEFKSQFEELARANARRELDHLKT